MPSVPAHAPAGPAAQAAEAVPVERLGARPSRGEEVEHRRPARRAGARVAQAEGDAAAVGRDAGAGVEDAERRAAPTCAGDEAPVECRERQRVRTVEKQPALRCEAEHPVGGDPAADPEPGLPHCREPPTRSDEVERVALAVERVAAATAVRVAPLDAPLRREDGDRPAARDDQAAAREEVVRVASATGEDEALGAAEVGEEDALVIGREGKPPGSEGDVAAGVRIQAAGAPDEPPATEDEDAAGAVAANLQIGAVAASGAGGVGGEPAARQPPDATARFESEAAALRRPFGSSTYC